MRNRRWGVLLISLLLVTVQISSGFAQTEEPTADAATAGAAFTIEPRRCPVSLQLPEVEGTTYSCGVAYVPENYAKPDGRVISLSFMVMKSASLAPAPDPVIYLSGGPGSSALVEIGTPGTGLVKAFAGMRERRDIIIYDQRGTRYSSMIYCSPWSQIVANADSLADPDTVSQFSQALAQIDDKNVQAGIAQGICATGYESIGMDITQYNSAVSSQDIAHLAEMLGYTQGYNLYGISYGTRLALTAMRDTPEHIRSVVLDSTYPPEIQNYETAVTLIQEPYQNIFALCAADAACNAAYPNLDTRFKALLQELETNPIQFDEPVKLNSLLAFRFGETLQTITPQFFIDLARLDNAAVGGGYAGLIPALIATMETRNTDLLKTIFTLATEQPAPDPDSLTELQRLQLQDAQIQIQISQMLAQAQQAATAALPSSQWLVAVLTNLSSRSDAGEDVKLAQLELMSLPLFGETADNLIAFANQVMPPDVAQSANALVSQMSRDDIRATYELIQTVGIKLAEVESEGNSTGMQFAVECAEEMPFQNTDRANQIVSSLPYPQLARDSGFLTIGETICQFYPGAAPDEKENQRVVSDIPTLLFQGEIDTQTPFSWGKSAAEGLSHGFFVAVPNSGHSVIQKSQCAQDIAAAFMDAPTSEPNTTCVGALGISFVVPNAQS